jgi:hypothetical protein
MTTSIGTISDTDADLKDALNSNVQQGVSQELCTITTKNNTEISRVSKLQRKCPKVKHKDFYGTENA